jgi:mono/diheme cytochrome c family protein
MNRTLLTLCSLLAPLASSAHTLDGAELYSKNCSMCHQAAGQGVPNIFPPLAGSDFIKQHRPRAIKALVEGLSGKIQVNGTEYNQAMPAVLLDDAQVASVLSYVFQKKDWGNAEAAVTAEEVSKIRATSKFPTFKDLLASMGKSPLPTAPAGWQVREAAELSFSPVRLAKRAGSSKIQALEVQGIVWEVDPIAGTSEVWCSVNEVLDKEKGQASCMGMGWDKAGRFYLTVNQRDEKPTPVVNHITIYRSAPVPEGTKPVLQPWFQTEYPYGIGGFNHGVSHIAEGPDGMLYVASGSRTDGNEPGKLERHFKGGEVDLTACLWRLNPHTESAPKLETYARGLRNPYGFTWIGQDLFLSDNGPDADAPEELNRISQGKHYGFPFQFSDWTEKPYPYTPDAPTGQVFMRPMRNLGPAGGVEDAGKPISTYSPHSSPAGIIHLQGEAYPASDRNTLWVVRYGILLSKPKDTGFDLLRVRFQGDPATATEVHVEAVLNPLARPIDLLEYSPGTILIAEHGRGTNYAAGLGQPGRILEMKAVKTP